MAAAPRYVMKSNGAVVCVGDTVRVHGEKTGVVVDLMREAPNQHGHDSRQWLAAIEWGRIDGVPIVSAWRVESCTVVTTPHLFYSTASAGLPGGLAYVNSAAVLELAADPAAPRNPYVSGYGGKIPTRYRVKLNDRRTRRVYVMQYGNSGSPYIRIAGRDVFLGVELEHLLQEL